jgi:hypothetical protein
MQRGATLLCIAGRVPSTPQPAGWCCDFNTWYDSMIK